MANAKAKAKVDECPQCGGQLQKITRDYNDHGVPKILKRLECVDCLYVISDSEEITVE